MIKITTLFKKNPDNLALVTTEIDPANEWAIKDEGIATRKFDGTAAAVIDGELYKRYDVKRGKTVPFDAIPCQEADLITEHWPHWVLCDLLKHEDRYFREAWDNQDSKLPDGTYELCGPKINGNKENLKNHELIEHGKEKYFMPEFKDSMFAYDYLKFFLSQHNIEGIVFHHPDGRMCKIRKSDFGIKR